MAARSKARKRALDILFEADLRGLPTLELLSERQSLGEVPVQPYAADLVRGVATHSERIDELISWNLVDWTLERMPAVDRNILRIGIYELLWADSVPDGVAISEAVALAQDLSTDNSPPFVNGVLARIKAEKPSLSLDPEASAFASAEDEEDDEDEDGKDPYADDDDEEPARTAEPRPLSVEISAEIAKAAPGTFKCPGRPFRLRWPLSRAAVKRR
jgi:transcription antitermination protein NusB